MRQAPRVRWRRPLPVLDLAAAGGRRRPAFLDRLQAAAAGPGAFLVTNHGVPAGLGELVLTAARDFFAAPAAEHLQVAKVHSPHFRGYTPARADRLERFDLGPEQPARHVGPDDPPWHRLSGPNLWPDSMPTLEPLMLVWTDAMTALAARLLRLLASSLQLPGDVFDAALTDEPHTRLALTRHPSTGAERSPGALNSGLERDYGFLTVLLADHGATGRAGGLRVGVAGSRARVLDVSARGAPGEAFVVTVGRLLEVATRGYLRSASYAPAPSRVAVPFTLGPALDATVPAPPLAARLTRAARGGLDDPTDPLLAGYGAYILRDRLTAHPQVAERHHPELLTAG